MRVTSVKIGTTELLVPGTYWVAQDTYYALQAGVAQESRLVQMAGRSPAYVGRTPRTRMIPLLVYLLATTAAERMNDYEALMAVIEGFGENLIAVEWTEVGVTRRYWCVPESVTPSRYMTRVAIAMMAPQPVAEVVT